jgi:REP element-mobilizing transposase RayT
MPDHAHMMIAIPPKYAVSQVVAFIKGKSAVHLARTYGERKRNFVGEHSRITASSRSTVDTQNVPKSTSASKRLRTRDWTKWGCGADRPP